jgi:glutaredoxin
MPKHSFPTPAIGLAAALLLACAGTPAAAAEVYRWKDANGVTHYSDSRPAATTAEQVVVRDSAGLDGGGRAYPAVTPERTVPAAVQPSILMYDNPNCGYCRRAKQWFNQRGLAFRTIDITVSKQNHDAFLRDGGRGTPLIFVDGVAVSGFNQARLEKLIP